AAQSSRLEQGKHSRLLSSRQTAALHHTISALTDAAQQLADAPSPDFAILKNDFEKRVSQNQKLALCASSQLEQLFLFCERAFPRGQELLLLVTELTVNEASARFISRYGCPKYFEHNQELLFYERNQEILVKLEQLKL
ncbi:MAG: ATPase, partial [Lachnospiraceae bacterium]|nr:ATPase [Lachnospiraceae bacterium]